MNRGTDLIDVAELARALGAPSCRVVDCRFDLFDADKGYADYLAGHIPGAVYANLDTDLASAITPSTGRHPLPSAGVVPKNPGGLGNQQRFPRGRLRLRQRRSRCALVVDVAVLDGSFTGVGPGRWFLRMVRGRCRYRVGRASP